MTAIASPCDTTDVTDIGPAPIEGSVLYAADGRGSLTRSPTGRRPTPTDGHPEKTGHEEKSDFYRFLMFSNRFDTLLTSWTPGIR